MWDWYWVYKRILDMLYDDLRHPIIVEHYAAQADAVRRDVVALKESLFRLSDAMRRKDK